MPFIAVEPMNIDLGQIGTLEPLTDECPRAGFKVVNSKGLN